MYLVMGLGSGKKIYLLETLMQTSLLQELPQSQGMIAHMNITIMSQL